MYTLGFEEIHRIVTYHENEEYCSGVNPNKFTYSNNKRKFDPDWIWQDKSGEQLAFNLQSALFNQIEENNKVIVTNEMEELMNKEIEEGKDGITSDNNDLLKNTQEQVIENVSNEVLANNVSEKLGYEFSKYILVKPMPIDKVFKTLTVPEDSGEKDAEGEPIMQMTIKEIETDSKLRKGVVITVPASMQIPNQQFIIKPGDTIVYPNTRSIDFDLYKDTALVEPYDVVAKLA